MLQMVIEPVDNHLFHHLTLAIDLLPIFLSIRRGPKSAPGFQKRKVGVKSTQQRPKLSYQNPFDSLFIPTKMKLSATLIIALLPLLTVANPVANPNPNPAKLEARDKGCTIDGKHDFVNCREGAGSGYKLVRKVYPKDHFGVGCKAYGQVVEGKIVWDYIPGWKCWMTAAYTNDGCEGKL